MLLPEREGYVHSDYLTITDTGAFSLSLDGAELSSLLELLTSGLSDGTGAALTPDGNLSLVDDIGGTASGKQFITAETKSGNVFYLIIDRDDEGAQTVHFLNQVDEADLMALLEDDSQNTPVVCSCTEKCTAGKVNTNCALCKTDMTNCAGKEAMPEETEQPDEPTPEKKNNVGGILILVLILAAGGGGALWYFKLRKPKSSVKGGDELDEFDFDEDDEAEEYGDYEDGQRQRSR